jgi:hypothetical protein
MHCPFTGVNEQKHGKNKKQLFKIQKHNKILPD